MESMFFIAFVGTKAGANTFCNAAKRIAHQARLTRIQFLYAQIQITTWAVFVGTSDAAVASAESTADNTYFFFAATGAGDIYACGSGHTTEGC